MQNRFLQNKVFFPIAWVKSSCNFNFNALKTYLEIWEDLIFLFYILTKQDYDLYLKWEILNFRIRKKIGPEPPPPLGGAKNVAWK